MRMAVSAMPSGVQKICLGLAFMLLLVGCQPVQPPSALPQTSATATGATAATNVDAENDAEIDIVTIHGGNESTIREFLRQYLISPFPPNDDLATSVYIGTLPPDLPFTLELPDSITTVGSVVTTGEYASSQLLFRLDQDVTESIAELRGQLQSQGYTQLARPRNEIFQLQNEEYQPLCSPEGTQAVMVNGRNLAGGTGIIRVTMNEVLAFSGPCTSPPAGGAGESSDIERVMPTLAAPPDVLAFQSGISSGGEGVEATVGFRGDTTVAALAEHYNAELDTAGWQQSGASQTEDMAWSGWSLTEGDQAFTATFYIVRDAGSSDRFRASLRVARASGR